MDVKTRARRAVRAGTKGYLWARGYALGAVGRPGGPDNIYFATVQRSGSQWIKSIFNDSRIRQRTGLRVYPQHRYEWGEFRKRFPKGTFVPGLYVSYDLYDEIRKPEDYRTFFVMRDPRSMVVSWYWAARDTGPLIGKVPEYRSQLEQKPFEEGLLYGIEALATRFADLRTWIYHAGDPSVMLVKFEELTAKPKEVFADIMRHCRVDIAPKDLVEILDDYTKDKMRERDMRHRSTGEESHYRQRGSTHDGVFTERHYEAFYSATGDLTKLLGYE